MSSHKEILVSKIMDVNEEDKGDIIYLATEIEDESHKKLATDYFKYKSKKLIEKLKWLEDWLREYSETLKEVRIGLKENNDIESVCSKVEQTIQPYFGSYKELFDSLANSLFDSSIDISVEYRKYKINPFEGKTFQI